MSYQSALRIAGVYLLFGLIWILLSDQVLQSLVADPRRLTALQTFKGWAYVMVTAGLIYWLVRREIVRYDRLRAKSEASIRASEERYRNLIDTAQEGIWVLNAQARTDFVNPRMAEMLGYRVDEMLGHSLYDFMAAEAREAAEAHFRRREQGIRETHEFRFRHQDGREILTLITTNPLYLPGGKFNGAIGLVTDITARKHAESALLETQARLVQAESNAHIGHWWLEADSHKAYWADEIYHILGLDPAQPAGPETLSRRVYPDDWGKLYASLRCAVDKGGEHHEEFRILRPDGVTRWVDCRGKAVRDADDGIIRVVGTFQDITERKQAEAEIRKLNAELEQRVRERTAQLAELNRELESFAYSVSHDLKAPLRGIDGYGQLLEQDHAGQMDEEGRQFLRNIRQGTRQMHDLIEDLLAYSHLERRTPRSDPIDLAALARYVVADRAEDIRARGGEVAVDMPPVTARADWDGLTLAVRNLLDNALKFSRPGHPARIEIGARPGDAAVTLWIKDNGIGFDMAFHDRIFDIFQRLHGGEDYPGTGIGLAIVRKSVQRMGGRVWADSAPGRGATFYLELPA